MYLLGKSVECLCTEPGVELMCFRVCFVSLMTVPFALGGVECIYFRACFVKVRETSYNFMVIRGFLFMSHLLKETAFYDIIFKISRVSCFIQGILCEIMEKGGMLEIPTKKYEKKIFSVSVSYALTYLWLCCLFHSNQGK